MYSVNAEDLDENFATQNSDRKTFRTKSDYPDNEKDYDWSNNDIFLSKYKKIYEDTVKRKTIKNFMGKTIKLFEYASFGHIWAHKSNQIFKDLQMHISSPL